MIYIVTTKRNKFIGVAFSPEQARTRARCSQSPKCYIHGYREGCAVQFYEVVENAAPQPKPSAPVIKTAARLEAGSAFHGTSYQGPQLDYDHLSRLVHWRHESPKESDWYWSASGRLATVRWFEIGWGWSVGVPVMCTPETAAHLATCRAEVQTGIRWALINRDAL